MQSALGRFSTQFCPLATHFIQQKTINRKNNRREREKSEKEVSDDKVNIGDKVENNQNSNK